MQTYREFYEQSRKRRRRRARRRALAVALVLLLIFGLAGLIVKIVGSGEDAPSSSSQPSSSLAASSEPSSGASSAPEADAMEAKPEEDVLAPLPNMSGTAENNTVWNTAGPVEQTLDYTISSPDYRMIALPECGVVDTSYFNTATFVGDSLTQGLQLYATGLPNAHYCAYKGVGPNSIVNGATQTRADGGTEIALDALVASQPDYVYILLGTNTLVNTGNEEGFIAYYGKMIDMFRENLLDGVKIYIQAIPPVRPEVARQKAGLENGRLRNVNNMLAQLALEKDCYFVDLQECLADEEGNLKAEYAYGDGIHMKPEGYQAWVDYLASHTAYDKRNPYLYGSPYYIPGA